MKLFQNYKKIIINIRIDKINGKLLDNIVEYNKNLTPDEVNGTNVNNILKYNNLMSVSEFDKMLIAKQYQKLYGLSNESTEEVRDNFENSKFMNLSLREILYNFVNVLTDLLDEVPNAYKNGTLNMGMIMREDRIIYVGLFLILLSVLFYFMHL